MGVLKKFEQRLEGLVNGTFAKVFKSEVQPVEIAGALQRECDNNATIWNRGVSRCVPAPTGPISGQRRSAATAPIARVRKPSIPR